MRIGWRVTAVIVVIASAMVASVLYLYLSQPKLEDTLAIYGPRGITGLATAPRKCF